MFNFMKKGASIVSFVNYNDFLKFIFREFRHSRVLEDGLFTSDQQL